MEIKINREIRNYTESVFLGLTPRQRVCSLLGILTSVAVFFLAGPALGTEATSYLCVIAVVPFAVFGFVKYHGMPAEKFIWAWLKSEVFEPRRLVYKSRSVYYAVAREELELDKKEEKRK